MKIRHSPYTLKPKFKLSAKADASERVGALLRVEFTDGSIGYADCHPWPELGDAPLKEQLRAIGQTSLTLRSLEFARLDAQARAKAQSLWKGLEIPPSHALLNHVDAEVPAGFDRVKIKAGPDFQLRSLERFRSEALKVRLDFNETLSAAQFSELAPDLHDIDFVEDPFRWSASHGFGESPVRLAVDRAASPELSVSICPPVLIIKPATQNWEKMIDYARSHKRAAVVTSYLDHPFGQLTAAYVAAKAARELGTHLETCGLLSHDAYESHAFSALLNTRERWLLPPEGTGFGWDEELAKLPWKDLP